MTSPADVERFHAEYDRHPDDRVRLFRALGELLPATSTVLYPGSYIDIAASVWFDDVTYVDTDKRAARFFAQHCDVAELVAAKRDQAGRDGSAIATIAFHHLDYRAELPIADASVDLLVSLYAGFVSEHCTRYVRPGGLIVVNNSHGDASLASLDAANDLVAVVLSRDGTYRVSESGLDAHLEPKRGGAPTADEVRELGRGIAFTKPAYTYVFRRR